MGKRPPAPAPFRLLCTPEFPAGDDMLIGALLAVGNGDPYEFATGRGTGVTQPLSDSESTAMRADYQKLLLTAAADRARLAEEFMPIGLEVLSSANPRMVIQFGNRGFVDSYVRDFRTLKSALNYAVMLLLNYSKPYGAALCRCRLHSCGRFYLAAKNPRGGPANRNYCSPDHRSAAHDRKENRRPVSRKHK